MANIRGQALVKPLLIGGVAGARSLTPLAFVTDAARRGRLPTDNGAPAWLGHPIVAAGAAALAAGEILGDKLASAPDRIVPAGMAVRMVTGALAGAALSPRRQAGLSAMVGAGAAIVAAFATFRLRMWALRRYGQTASGVVEDAAAAAAASAIVGARAG